MKKRLAALLCAAMLTAALPVLAWADETPTAAPGATQLVQVASQFNSEIYVEIGKKRVNAKSIMGMMTLGLDAGEEITLSANGEDEEAAMAGIEQYLSNQ